MRVSGILLRGAVCFACFLSILPSAVHARAPAAEILSLHGQGEFAELSGDPWVEAEIAQDLFSGNLVRTGASSRMGLLFTDRTQLRLAELTTLQVKPSAVTPGNRLFLEEGRAWTRSSMPKGGLLFETPSATAAIRGTAWELEVAPDGSALITVLSGEVEFFNNFGRILVTANEQGRAEIGKPPVKLQLVRPRDRVQWVNAMQLEPRRYLTPELEQAHRQLRQAAAAIESGRLAEAEVSLERLGAAQPGLAEPWLMASELSIFAGDLARAEAQLAKGLASAPGDARLPVQQGRISLLRGDLPAAEASLARARDLAADSVAAALLEGDISRLRGNAEGAVAAYRRATELVPEDDRGWYGLGLAATEREQVRKGRSFLNQAITLRPGTSGYLGQLGTLESFANEFAAAEQAFSAAIGANSEDFVARTGQGILRLKQGATEDALENFLGAGLLEPGYARAPLYAGVAQYQLGNVEQALKDLDLAARLDDKDPLPHYLAAIIHTDGFQAGAAIDEARKALQLMPYLRSLNQIANDSRGTANLGQSFAFLGLEDWARSYAKQSYLQEWGGSHLFMADHYSGLYTKNSELFQGFLTDPTAFGASNRFQTLLPRPGAYATGSFRLARGENDLEATSPFVELRALGINPWPVAVYGAVERFNAEFDGLPYDQDVVTGAIGMQPRHDLGLFLFGDSAEQTSSEVVETEFGTVAVDDKLTSERLDLGLHFQVDPGKDLWLKAGGFESEDELEGTIGGLPAQIQTLVDANEYALRQGLRWGRHTISLGFELTQRDTDSEFVALEWFPDIEQFALSVSRYRYDEHGTDLYLADQFDWSDALTLEAMLSYQDLERSGDYETTFHFLDASFLLSEPGDRFSQQQLNPRFGLTYRFGTGRVLRLAYQDWLRPVSFSTLAPVATAGIPVDDRLVAPGGELQRLRLQLEWEIDGRNFVSGYADRQEIDNRYFSAYPFTLNDIESLEKLRTRDLGSLHKDDLYEFVLTPTYAGATIQAAGLSFNRLFTPEWGGYVRYEFRDSENNGDRYPDNQVPFLPRHAVALGATWVHPSGWYWGGRAVWRDQRYIDEANSDRLDAGWTGAFDLFRESSDKHWLLRLSADEIGSDFRDAMLTAEVSLRF